MRPLGRHVTILQEQVIEHSCLQVCGLSALYCCYTVDDEPVSTVIPSKWPPNAAPIPAGLNADSLDCASGNCTEESLPPPAVPAAVPPALPEGEMLSSWHISIVKPLQKLLAVRLSFWQALKAWSTLFRFCLAPAMSAQPMPGKVAPAPFMQAKERRLPS